jgi:hypothetical protein
LGRIVPCSASANVESAPPTPSVISVPPAETKVRRAESCASVGVKAAVPVRWAIRKTRRLSAESAVNATAVGSTVSDVSHWR